MFKLDNDFLQSLGLGGLPVDEKNRLLQMIYERLEMNVGMRLAEKMSDAQLDEFEGFIDRNDEAGALKWLETNFPNYKDVVAEELEKLKGEVQLAAPQILAAQSSGGAMPPIAQAPMMPGVPEYQIPNQPGSNIGQPVPVQPSYPPMPPQPQQPAFGQPNPPMGQPFTSGQPAQQPQQGFPLEGAGQPPQPPVFPAPPAGVFPPQPQPAAPQQPSQPFGPAQQPGFTPNPPAGGPQLPPPAGGFTPPSADEPSNQPSQQFTPPPPDFTPGQ